MSGVRTKSGQAQAWMAEHIARVDFGDECIEWPFSKKGKGYGQFFIGNKKCTGAHQYVLTQLSDHPKLKGMECAHSCANKACVNPNHLRWATSAENKADNLLHGTHNRGERQGQSKLTEAQVLEIYKDPRPQREIAKDYAVQQMAISRIKTGETWGWLTRGAGS